MNIYITLDYELFLGDNTGTPENCLIRPMNALCNAIDKYGVKLIIFVDAAYLLRMCQLKDKHKQVQKDYDLVTDHVKKLNSEGHDIQLHFHPQWLYSNWDEKENKWILDFNHYKLSDMNKKFAFKTFSESKHLLDNLIGKKTIAFRAGGYSLETFTDYIKLFGINGIKIDSSVFRKAKLKSEFAEYDYRNIPNKMIYRFRDNLKNEDKSGEFLELSIYSCRWNPIYYFSIVRPIVFNYHPRIIYKDGTPTAAKNKTSFIKKLKKLSEFKIFQGCIDGRMSNVLDMVYKDACSKNVDNLVLIGHPKNFSDTSINNLERFIKNTAHKNNFLTTINIT